MKKTVLFLAILLSFVSVFGLTGCKNGKSDRTTYTIDCALTGHELTATERVNFYNSTDTALTEIKFNLFGNAFRKDAKYNPISAQYTSRAYPNGLSYGDMDIKKVTCGDTDLRYSVCGEDQNVLSVELMQELFPDERVEMVIEYTLNLANVVARTGYNDHTINLANFYPIVCAYDDAQGFYECLYYANGDPFYSDCADYTVNLTANSEYNVAASGKLISRTENGKTSQSCYQITNARSFALVLSKEFESVTKTVGETEIIYYFYDDKTPDKSMDYAVKSMTLFEEKFGDYPYPTYSVVQTEFIQGGMEFPGLVMISDNLEPEAYGEVIVHETAHQWWQSVVGNNEIEHAFLDEGLAEYSVITFYENYPEYNMTREQLVASSEKTYKVFCSVYDKVHGKVNTVMNRDLGEFTSEYEYVNMAYIKPCIMFDYLRQTVGEETFFKGLKNYYKEYKFKNATPDDLVGVYEKLGADSNGFFDSFFEGKVII